MGFSKYIKAQEYYIDDVKTELSNGKKEGHWIWFVFPQLKGLGKSVVSDYYGLNSIDEAREYYENEYLRKNLNSCTKIVLKLKVFEKLEGCFGEVDTKKFHSCMTLFWLATNQKIFKNALDTFFNGLLDSKTVILLKRGNE